MKPLRTIFLLFAVSLCAPRGLAQTGAAPTGPPPPAAEYNPKNWKEFTSEEGRFSALFPGTPVRQVGKAEQGEMYMYLLRTFAEYAVMYIEFPQPTIDTAHIKAMLDGGRDSGLASVEGRLLEEKDISLDGYTGRYHKVLAGTGHTLRSRTYVVGNRMYVVFIVMRDEGAPPAILKFHDETAAKFLDSFKLIPHGPPAGAAGGRSPVGEPKGQPAAEAQTEGEVNRLLRQMSERGEDAGLILGSRDESATPSPSESKPEGGLTGKILEQPAAEYPPKYSPTTPATSSGAGG